ncbi:SET domain-containing protein [Saccharata proteae CBS 121410]|uniref:SET domain-containing protein n=1 Tax=Saccharata proteae CBS 121410 TaxID=1314787 RepID=A0A9P4LZK4_9PEZI|nr:SET domain-containing protein [Saccharata proteae CBS 121410]
MEKDSAYVKASPVAGNGLFAKKDVPAGELLFAKERPLLAVLDSPNMDGNCAYCFSGSYASMFDPANFELKACTGCKITKYCSKKCQSRSWKHSHKFECPVLKDIGTERKLPNAVRALMQILSRKIGGIMPDEEWSAVMNMESHISSMKPEKLDSVRVLSHGALKFSKAEGRIDEKVAEEIFARILTNSLTLTSANLDPIGICLDPLGCAANHSCEPNAFVVFDGADMSFRALKPVRKDEEIFISYIDNTNPFARRQAELQDRFCFTCDCPKCQKRFSAREDQFKPSKSPEQISKERRLSAVQGQAFDDLEQARKLGDGSFWEPALARVTRGLALLSDSDMWPPTRQPYAALRDELVVLYSASQRFPMAWQHMVRRYFDIDPILYPEPHHPVRVIHNFMLSTQTLYMFTSHHMDELYDLFEFPPGFEIRQIVYGLLAEVFENVASSHGPTSNFAKFVQSRMQFMRSEMPDRGKHWEETLPRQLELWKDFVYKQADR